jgi:hypothetical protein
MKINAYLLWIVIASILFMGLIVTFGVYLTPNINYDTNATNLDGYNLFFGETYSLQATTVPTVINGLTAVTSVIIGFSGAVIGLIYREDFNKDKRSKLMLLGFLFYFILPLVFLLIVYNALLYGALSFALKWALNALVLALAELILSMLAIFYRLDGEKNNPVPSEIKTVKEPSVSEKDGDNTVQNALNKLAEMTKIVTADAKTFYVKKASEVDNQILITIANSFVPLSVLFQEFTELWFNSIHKGPDAVQPSEELSERIDIKLLESGKLDFAQMKKILTRLNRINDAQQGTERMIFYISQYENLCKEKNLEKERGYALDFRVYCLEELSKHLKDESKDLKGRLDRCNLYYQAQLNTTTVKVAYFALIVSMISALLTVLGFIFFR